MKTNQETKQNNKQKQVRKKLTKICLALNAERHSWKDQFFYDPWFDPTENRTRVYRFSNKRSIPSTIDRLTQIKQRAEGPLVGAGAIKTLHYAQIGCFFLDLLYKL